MNLVITGDGSHSIYIPGLNENYHSSFGAITESMHVFIQSGLQRFPADRPVTILEIGFGTGLNALLTVLDCIRNDRKVLYHTLEKFPLDPSITDSLNYPSLLDQDLQPDILFNAIHQTPWNQMTQIARGFCMRKIHHDLLIWKPDFSYDLVYFDAFAPDKQQEMWTQEIFSKITGQMNPEGILVTYCVKGSVKQALRNEGLKLEKLPGPPGKREILRATKLIVN